MRQTVKLLIFIVCLSGCGGANGVNGTNGTNGTSEQIAHSYKCSAIDNGSGTNIEFWYDSYVMTSGDRMVVGQVDLASLPATNTQYYPSTVPGATTGGIIVNNNLQSVSGFGFWTFQDNNGTVTVQYSDPSSPKNGYEFTIPKNECAGT